MPADRSADAFGQNAPVTPPAPPLPWLIAYRVLGLRLPAEHRDWVAKDVASSAFVSWRIGRTVLWLATLLGLYYVVQGVVHQPPHSRTMVRLVLLSAAVALLASRNTLARHALRWQRIDRHGRPIRPKRLAILGNEEALLLGAIVLVAYTGATAVFAHALRPTSCREPDAAVLQRIQGALKSQETQIRDPQALPFGQGATRATLIGSSVRKAGSPQPTLTFWLVQGEQIYELGAQAQTVTTFGPPTAVDRTAIQAVQTVATCVTEVSR